eukprot:3555410-Rhodomonas_salina.1
MAKVKGQRSKVKGPTSTVKRLIQCQLSTANCKRQMSNAVRCQIPHAVRGVTGEYLAHAYGRVGLPRHRRSGDDLKITPHIQSGYPFAFQSGYLRLLVE